MKNIKNNVIFIFLIYVLTFSAAYAAATYKVTQEQDKKRFTTTKNYYPVVNTNNNFDNPKRNTSYGIIINGPDIAENGAVVPISVSAFGMNGVDRYLKEIKIYTCEMLEPIARFEFHTKTASLVRTRIKMRRSNEVYAIGVMNTGELLLDKKYIKNTIGGCGGGSGPVSEFDNMSSGYTRSKPEVLTWRRSSLLPNTVRLDVQGQDLPIVDYRTDVVIDGFRARVMLDVSFHNVLNIQKQGKFQLRLPENSSPYYVAFGDVVIQDDYDKDITVKLSQDTSEVLGIEPKLIDYKRYNPNSNIKEAVMVERQAANSAYWRTVYRNVDPALVEWEGNGVYTVNVFPLLPDRTHRIVLAYDVDLTRLNSGELEYLIQAPADILNSRVMVHVHKNNEYKLQDYSEPYKQTSIDEYEVLEYVMQPGSTVKLEFESMDNVLMRARDRYTGDYFAMKFIPDLPVKIAHSGEPYAVIAIDTSLSSRPESYEDYIQLASHLLTENDDTIKYFSVLLFDVGTRWWKPHFVKNTEENRDLLMAELNELSIAGATNMERALKEISFPIHDELAAVDRWDVFMLTDGRSTWGNRDVPALLARLEESHVSKLFVYVTRDRGTDLSTLEAIAEFTSGAVFTILPEYGFNDAAIAHRYQFWKLKRISVPGAKDVVVSHQSRDIYYNQPLLLAGRGSPNGEDITLELSNGSDSIYIQQPIASSIESDLTKRIFGQVAVEYIETKSRFDPAFVQAYAGYYRVPRQTMSLLMLESEADYKRFKINSHANFKKVVARQHFNSTNEYHFDKQHEKNHRFVASYVNRDVDKIVRHIRVKCKDWWGLRERYDVLSSIEYNIEYQSLIFTEKDVVYVMDEFLPWYDADRAYAAIREMALETTIENTKPGQLRILSSIIEIVPDDPLTISRIAKDVSELGYYTDAYYLWIHYIELAPATDDGYLQLARVLIEMGEIDYAILVLEVDMARLFRDGNAEESRILHQQLLRDIKEGKRESEIISF